METNEVREPGRSRVKQPAQDYRKKKLVLSVEQSLRYK